MKIIYLSRNFNEGGYSLLKEIADSQEHEIISTILPSYNKSPRLDTLVLNKLFKILYNAECRYYNCDNIRFLKSIKILAESREIMVNYCRNINSLTVKKFILSQSPDLILIGGGWPKKISKDIINIPKYGVLNFHPSLLPNFRGTSVHRWQIKNGTKISGFTFHFISEEYDLGNLVLQKTFRVSKSETPQTLYSKSVALAKNHISDVLSLLVRDDFEPIKNGSKKFGRWSWNVHNLKVDWSLSSQEIFKFIKSNNQESYKYYGPWFNYNSRKFIIRGAEVVNLDREELEPGRIIKPIGGGVLFSTGSKSSGLLVEKMQKGESDYWFHPSSKATTILEHELVNI